MQEQALQPRHPQEQQKQQGTGPADTFAPAQQLPTTALSTFQCEANRQAMQAPPMPAAVREEILTDAAVDRRLRRLMLPTAAGKHKVSQQIRDMWNDMDSRPRVFQLFGQCQFKPDPGIQHLQVHLKFLL